MKKIVFFSALLSLSLVSCKDDDNTTTTTEATVLLVNGI